LTVQERNSGNSVTREYAWGLSKGGGIGGLLYLGQASQSYCYVYDGKGNVVVVLDASEIPVASYGYDVFGLLLATNGNLDQPFGFSTKHYDGQAGLSDFGYRVYSAPAARWMNRDPIGEAGGLNLYVQSLNDPVNHTDALGLAVKMQINLPQAGLIHSLLKAAGGLDLVTSLVQILNGDCKGAGETLAMSYLTDRMKTVAGAEGGAVVSLAITIVQLEEAIRVSAPDIISATVPDIISAGRGILENAEMQKQLRERTMDDAIRNAMRKPQSEY